jgi:hypothetical protein
MCPILSAGKYLFLTNETGLSYSVDNGASWKSCNTGLRFMPIEEIMICGKYVYAGNSLDGGVWRCPVSSLK